MSECLFVSREAYGIGMASGASEVSPHLSVCGQWNVHSFIGEGRQSIAVWLQNPQPRGSVLQGCGDRILKAQTQLKIGAEVMALMIYRQGVELLLI